MSISGVSSISSAAYIQQSQGVSPGSATSQPATAPGAAATQAASAAPQANQVHHHHHHHGGGGAAAQPADLTQSGTAAANGTNILNTLA